MSDKNLFTIEKAKINHLEQVKEIESECGLSNWSRADYRLETERKDSIFNVCEINGQIAGFILARLIMHQINSSKIDKNGSNKLFIATSINNLPIKSENEVEIYNIGIKKKYRRIAIGTSLFQSLLEIARQNNVKKIWLEVRVSNSRAIKFYESRGFKIAGKRRNLYTNPSEDGLIMCLSI